MLAGWRAARLIAKFAGGTLEPVVGDLYPGRPESVKIELHSGYIERILGIQMSEAEVVRIPSVALHSAQHIISGWKWVSALARIEDF